MRFIDRLVGKGRGEPKRSVPRPAYGDINNAQRLQVEERVDRWRGRTAEMRELQERAHGTALTGAMLVARTLSDVPIRLYRARGGRKAMRPGYAKHLGDHRKVGRKAAYFADRAGKVEEVLDHPVLDLLMTPNPVQSASMFWTLTNANKILFGNGYAALTSETHLVSLLAPYVRVIPDDGDNLIRYYEYAKEVTRPIEIDPIEMMHLRCMPSMDQPFLGFGPLHNLIAEVDLDDAAMGAEIARWENGGSPSGIVSLKSATPQQIEDTQNIFEQMYSGVRNAGRFIFTADASVTQLGKPNEMGYVEGLGVVTTRILAALGIPESLYRLNDANLASSRTGHLQFMSQTIQPHAADNAEQMTFSMLPWFGLTPGEYFFAPDDVVPEDMEAKRLNAQVYVGAGVMTINEARAELQLAPIDGGDELRVNGIPLDDVAGATGGFFAPPPVIANDDDEAEPKEDKPVRGPKIEEQALNGAQIAQLSSLATQVQLGEMPKEAARAIGYAAFPGVPPEKIDAIFDKLIEGAAKPQEGGDDSESPKDEGAAKALAWPEADPYAVGEPCGICTKNAGEVIESTGEEEYEALRAEVAEWFDGIGRDLGRYVSSDGSVNLESAEADLLSRISPHLEAAFRSGAFGSLDKLIEAGFLEADDDGAFTLENVDATAYLEERGNLIIEQVRGTTEEALGNRLAEGVRSGESLGDLIPGVREAFAEATPARAEAIARTEVSNAIHQAELDTYKEVGVEFKQWFNSPNPSAVHAELARMLTKVPVDEPFIKAGTTVSAAGKSETYTRDIYAPPARPNCRCGMRPVRGDE